MQTTQSAANQMIRLPGMALFQRFGFLGSDVPGTEVRAADPLLEETRSVFRLR
jgi:hypothetical protein